MVCLPSGEQAWVPKQNHPYTHYKINHITSYEGFGECDLGVIKLVTKCKYATFLLFIQLTKKIDHRNLVFLKLAKSIVACRQKN